eukprot:m51a1_g5761 putative serine threonine-protein kinase ht1-like (437) ;mRNA; r:1215053-1217504
MSLDIGSLSAEELASTAGASYGTTRGRCLVPGCLCYQYAGVHGGGQCAQPMCHHFPAAHFDLGPIRREDLAFGPEIGAGRFSRVYRGSYNGTDVAIKTSLSRFVAEAVREMVATEIAMLTRVHHPNVVACLGASLSTSDFVVVTGRSGVQRVDLLVPLLRHLAGSCKGAATCCRRIRREDLAFGPEIGAGRFSRVYRGSYNGTDVAIKTSLSRFVAEAVREMVATEIAMLTRVHHPNVVACLGASLSTSDFVVVTELCELGTLHSLLHSATPLEWRTTQRILVGIARGMAFLHSRGILHRDLKARPPKRDGLATHPLRDGQPISDFGMSCTRSEPTRHLQYGSPFWMAPEVISKKLFTSDFGIVVFEVATRMEPYGNAAVEENWASVMWRVSVANERPAIPKECPELLASLMKRCWSRSPGLRPPFAEIVPLLVGS